MSGQARTRKPRVRPASAKVADAELRARQETAEQASREAAEGVVVVPASADPPPGHRHGPPSGYATNMRLTPLDEAGAPTGTPVDLGPGRVDARTSPGNYRSPFLRVGHDGPHLALNSASGDAEYNSSLGGDPESDTDSDGSPALQDEPDTEPHLDRGGTHWNYALGAGRPRLPIPRAVRARWWPAAVQLPGIPEPLRLAKVFATAQGLYVYNAASATDEPYWWSPILYDKTTRPATGHTARVTGIAIVTAAGRATVTPLVGCGCSNGGLKRYQPAWANRTEAWGD